MAKIGAVIAASFLLVAPSAWSADCPPACGKKLGELKKLEGEETRTTELLGKNRTYLAGLSPKEASKFIKVESNIMVILVRIEDIRKQITSLKSEMEKEGCNKCQ